MVGLEDRGDFVCANMMGTSCRLEQWSLILEQNWKNLTCVESPLGDTVRKVRGCFGAQSPHLHKILPDAHAFIQRVD